MEKYTVILVRPIELSDPDSDLPDTYVAHVESNNHQEAIYQAQTEVYEADVRDGTIVIDHDSETTYDPDSYKALFVYPGHLFAVYVGY